MHFTLLTGDVQMHNIYTTMSYGLSVRRKFSFEGGGQG